MKQQLAKITRKLLPKKVSQAVENTYRKSRLMVLSSLHGNPAKKVKVLAITGTNGKTTSISVLNEIIKASGQTTILSTTAGREIAGEKIAGDSCQTVPSTNELQDLFQLAIDKQVDYVLLETTSHALDQHKLPAMNLVVAGFTNLTQEHLDYHHTMQEYADAKLKLFTDFGSRLNIINADDQWFDYFKQHLDDNYLSYGTNLQADFQIKKVKLYKKGSEITIAAPQTEFTVSTPLAGRFNAYNVTLACWGLSQKRLSKASLISKPSEVASSGSIILWVLM